jgi:hypothetical protein
MVLALRQCFVRVSEQTATFALYIIDWLVFITMVESVYCAVQTDSLYKADYVSSLKVQCSIMPLDVGCYLCKLYNAKSEVFRT